MCAWPTPRAGGNKKSGFLKKPLLSFSSFNPKGNVTWSTMFDGRSYKTASHRERGDAPTGGNFLFEDGHVQWLKFSLNDPRNTVDVGSMSGD